MGKDNMPRPIKVIIALLIAAGLLFILFLYIIVQRDHEEEERYREFKRQNSLKVDSIRNSIK
jgi:hypothetical protein